MILVTGATGFLGAELAKELILRGNNIRCTKRSSSSIPQILQPYAAKIEWVDADLMDFDALEMALEGITQVYNCAAFVSLKQADKEPMIRTNVRGTANLVDICVEKGMRMVHTSSVAAVGEAKPGELITENHHLDSSTENDGYAISKLESEMEVWRGIAEGLDAVIVNPTIIIGASAGTAGSGQIFETVRQGLKFYTGGTIGFVDVQDVAKCMIALMETDISGERYIINAENRPYKQIFEEIAVCFGVKPPATLAKPWMMELAWRGASVLGFLTGKAPALDKTSARAASVTREFDNSKIKKAIGFEFKPVSESIKEICITLRH
ncbi:NAD-dependent epimerase/dehydratase family protein [Mucilaginibacter phyllosphaerae]|uniref:Nucleoside-diphosphate-sugar epimerase n=1 Tax=Mucilaginibacter phyllosphaerae TaxID=1812349 RepID=A0A4Y8AF50_9SPHI|nr:NAD-dependent epimerase/dehydratase family protein [Mucilaginibacter phyllosphaerae]MBB3968986.1 nucleoside-diphosphate-sugar epimerase [Mucilaginibacter phyllosphaerae]TEW67394.1 SDR family NAD(P)-dependent oxidoreductase [Mucilaginibacter phyllosphaerae]GGH23104.1 NAD-dependent epimerase [Mucilaginibacter phyllosphaerae]